jgi:hypothetical protein
LEDENSFPSPKVPAQNKFGKVRKYTTLAQEMELEKAKFFSQA